MARPQVWDMRTTLRLTKEMKNAVQRFADARGSGVSANMVMIEAIAAYIGRPNKRTQIVKNGNDFYWLMPNGFYGQVDKVNCKRLLNGIDSFVGEDWTLTFDSLTDASESLGTAVCYISKDRSLHIIDLDAFLELIKMI